MGALSWMKTRSSIYFFAFSMRNINPSCLYFWPILIYSKVSRNFFDAAFFETMERKKISEIYPRSVLIFRTTLVLLMLY